MTRRYGSPEYPHVVTVAGANPDAVRKAWGAAPGWRIVSIEPSTRSEAQRGAEARGLNAYTVTMVRAEPASISHK
jgi:hypothetical protein